MSFGDPLAERAVILAPFGRDAHLATLILSEAGVTAAACANVQALTNEIERGAALAIIAEEAIIAADLRPLASFVADQPTWSDLPFLLLTHRAGGRDPNPGASGLTEVLGNVTFLERPFRPVTFISLVRSALRARSRQYEARARLSEIEEGGRRLQTALRAGRLGSWTLAVDTMEFTASEITKSHFGIGGDQRLSYDDLCRAAHPDDVYGVRLGLTQTIQTGSDYETEYRTLWPDGSVHWIELRAAVNRGPKGAVSQLVGVSSDITDRKTSELQRERLVRDLATEQQALSELSRTLEKRVHERTTELMREVAAREKAQQQLVQAQKMESIGQLTGGIAHDFNNLLTVVIGNLSLLKKHTQNDERAQRFIAGAMQGAERSAALTQRMLAFARRQDLKTKSVDVGTLLEGMRDLLKHALGPGVELNFHVAPGLPPALIDSNQIELGILNLVINGRDAMPDGGKIDISVDLARAEQQQKLIDEGYIRLKVADTGAGMESSVLEKAIEPFFSTKPVGKGTGLGLSMVHGLVVQLGGLFEIASRPGEGTVVTLWLPIAASPALPVEAEVREPSQTRAATILVVDDDPLTATSTRDMLEDLGYRVTEVNSGRRALEVLDDENKFDLVITDFAMPGMTGLELARIIQRKSSETPILLASGYSDFPPGQTPDLPRLSKPFTQSKLHLEIENLLAHSYRTK